ncbi:hypothetical protein NP493_363g01036 [Ridgeia piscesae]|uniref:BMERB domain-containing protein n=1 Tax=Ridgeia piscesae TaxID=27915 RepID=A0AAD9L4A8_RIDPI|nr:hypothetical protein NP493_363g01036 [Ridgeia piscesae]
MREEDERLLQELLEVVEQRDALVAMLEEDRVKQRKQDEELREMMLLKGYELSPSIPEYKWQLPQSLFSSTSDTR